MLRAKLEICYRNQICECHQYLVDWLYGHARRQLILEFCIEGVLVFCQLYFVRIELMGCGGLLGSDNDSVQI